MDNPKIRIESDGIIVNVYLEGEKIRCTSLNFAGETKEEGALIKWDGVMQKLNENGVPYVENNEIATKEFHYETFREWNNHA